MTHSEDIEPARLGPRARSTPPEVASDILLAQFIAEYSLDLLTIHTMSGELLYVAHASEKLLGWTATALLGQSLYSLIHRDDVAQVALALAALEQRAVQRRSDQEVCTRYRLRSPHGDYRWVESRSRLGQRNGDVISFTRDIHKDVARQQLLERLAYYDPLTNLLNRRAIDRALHGELDRARRYGQVLSVALIDIDGFKRINDTRGHLAADDLLQAVSSCITRNKRVCDVLGRWGGDEFLLLLPRTPCTTARRILQRIGRQTVRELRCLSLSIGIGSTVDAAGANAHDLLQKADQALYRAKRLGGDHVITWNSSLRSASGSLRTVTRAATADLSRPAHAGLQL